KHTFTPVDRYPAELQRLVNEEWFTDEVLFRHARRGPFPAVLGVSAVVAQHVIFLRFEPHRSLRSVDAVLRVVDIAEQFQVANHDAATTDAQAKRPRHFTPGCGLRKVRSGQNQLSIQREVNATVHECELQVILLPGNKRNTSDRAERTWWRWRRP